MDKETKKLIRETMTKPLWVSAANALIRVLDSELVARLGVKYIWWGDYHWRLFYSKTKNKYTAHVNYVTDFFQGKKGKLLDVGCGEGLIVKRIREVSKIKCFGIDASPLAIEYAHQREINGCELIDFKDFNDNGFNYVFMGDFLEHLEEPEATLKKAKEQWLVDDGLLFVACPIQKDKGIADFHLFTEDSILELVRSVFAVCTFDIRSECQKMYITAYKPEFMEKLEFARAKQKESRDKEEK